jgi:hypothetical protein
MVAVETGARRLSCAHYWAGSADSRHSGGAMCHERLEAVLLSPRVRTPHRADYIDARPGHSFRRTRELSQFHLVMSS